MTGQLIFAPEGWFYSHWQEAWPQAQLLTNSQTRPNAKLVVVLTNCENWLDIVTHYSKDSAVLVLSQDLNMAELQQAIGAGARAYMDFASPVSTFQAAEQSINNGALWVPAGFLDKLIAVFNQVLPAKADPFSTLSAREQEVAQLVCQGLSNKAIALQLGMGERTVKQHLTNIFAKLGIKDRMQLLLVSRSA